MKLNIDDYVRVINTLQGYVEITKIKELYDYDGFFIDYRDYEYSTDEVIKSSPNVIDLVLSGDFIDGMQVFFEPDSLFDDKRVVILPGYLEYCPVSSLKNINHIVTKEEFESMGYKIGE